MDQVSEVPLSGFRTPHIPTSRWIELGELTKSFNDDHVQRGEKLAETNIFDISKNLQNTYPSWGGEIPISKQNIEAIFIQLTDIFGFQYDNTRNMFDHFMRLLDSRASRMEPWHALRTLHADYIGGVNANFRRWYFAAQLDLDDSIGFENCNADGTLRNDKINVSGDSSYYSLEESEKRWCINMDTLSPADYVIQVALYLLCWGEANNIRFIPECLCFIFKCCNDYFYSLDVDSPVRNVTPSFLDHAITPIYNFYRENSYDIENGKYIKHDKDHHKVIGYDDINQLFWYPGGLKKIILGDKSKTKLMKLPPSERYLRLNEISWKKVFFKTFKERRTWSHVLVNFNRIWIIHISVFWLYTVFNSPTLYTKNYKQELDNQPTTQVTLTLMSLGGGISSLICIICILFEYTFVPRGYSGAEPLLKRLLLLIFILLLNVLPTAYIMAFHALDHESDYVLILASVQFGFSILTNVYLSLIPLSSLFKTSTSKRRYLSNTTFLGAYYELMNADKSASYGLWFAIFILKFFESYYYLTLSLRDPVRELSTITLKGCIGDAWLGQWFCSQQPIFVLILIYITDLVLFFLDTYLWYIVWNTTFSVCRSFYIGVSIWTPWKNVFTRLPKRIFSKIISTKESKLSKSTLVSEVWNSIVIAMYREHLLSIEHVHKLIYQQVLDPESGYILKEPIFFISQEDQISKMALFENEALRRITFFAQSLSTPMPEVGPMNSMPSFSVLIPHYSEKITLGLKEIIKQDEQFSQITMLEYLKQLHPFEWDCYVRDTKMFAEEFESSSPDMEIDAMKKLEDISYHSVGYKVATPEYVLRTRIWASLRSQTLYRTISGFMNYSRAIKLLYDVEEKSKKMNGEVDEREEAAKLEDAAIMALRKFRIIASMQRMKNFTEEEQESTEFLLRSYPELQIAYLSEEMNGSGETEYYSVLIDGNSAILESGERKPKYKIKLSGNPILGDGKSDNQNHSLIFCRGEFIQLVDANQDNYLEECLKIRNVLAEFEDISHSSTINPYSSVESRGTIYEHPIAIIGTREYIFSENIGILGDVAAGKEQTFGTLLARTLAHVGGKLHYGHPDFLNSIFMATRGGVSKTQKGLHLNEDIYAGMNAIMRGGRIKHCEYMQCGKGRDLGFGSILNFTTKIGAGMGEQILSREYFHLGTRLPIDRFLSFYYAHPGFHLNNVFIMLSIKLFLLVGINLAALTNEATICDYNKHKPITDPRKPVGCHNLMPVVEWLKRCILSIFIVFSISFVPLCFQELTERGFLKAFTRLAKHFASFSLIFEVFVCRIYAQSLIGDINIGGAKYIATGRGFATVRIPFSILYSRFARESLYVGAFSLLLVLYTSLSMWTAPLMYFWMTIFSLLFSPCLFNPNQFSWHDFFLDYRKFLKWLHRGNTQFRSSSWIGYVKLSRSKITGIKKKKLKSRKNGKPELKVIGEIKPSSLKYFTTQLPADLIGVLVIGTAYMFSNAQNEARGSYPTFALMRILILSALPIVLNIAILLAFFVISCIFGPMGSLISRKFPSIIALTVHSLSVLNYVFHFQLLWYLQSWDFSRTVIGCCVVIKIQSVLFRMITTIIVTKEFENDRSNMAWWSGKWITSGLGWHIFSQPLREFLVKISELSYFTLDYFLGHFILFAQFPIVMFPYINTWHSLMLFWLKPTHQMKPRVLNKFQKRKRRGKVIVSVILYITSLLLVIAIFLVPMVAINVFDIDFDEFVPNVVQDYIQPYSLVRSRKGIKGVKYGANF